jgi:hypothetical protein
LKIVSRYVQRYRKHSLNSPFRVDCVDLLIYRIARHTAGRVPRKAYWIESLVAMRVVEYSVYTTEMYEYDKETVEQRHKDVLCNDRIVAHRYRLCTEDAFLHALDLWEYHFHTMLPHPYKTPRELDQSDQPSVCAEECHIAVSSKPRPGSL